VNLYNNKTMYTFSLFTDIRYPISRFVCNFEQRTLNVEQASLEVVIPDKRGQA